MPLEDAFANYDPRVLDPASEQEWWRNRRDASRTSAFDHMGAGAVNLLGALGGFAFGNPAAQRTRTALGRYVFGSPDGRLRSTVGNAIGWGNIGLGGYQGYGAYQQSRQHQEALEALERLRRGPRPSDFADMRNEAFAPRVPGSR